MKIKHLIYLSLLVLGSCKNTTPSAASENQNSNLVAANQFIDAFYSFKRDSLKSTLSRAFESQPGILYYQKWAECGNYEVIKRHNCIEKNDSLVICPVTVKDDLIGALKINMNVTDTFHLTIKKGPILAVETSSNDPDLYYQAKDWIKENRPELIEEPCKGAWEGGPTPCECVQGMVKGFNAFKANEN